MRDVTTFLLSLQRNSFQYGYVYNMDMYKNCIRVIIKYKLHQLYIK